MYIENKADGERLGGYSGEGPSLSGLAYILRHPETWPKGFEWDYWDSGCCAMGLAKRFWPEAVGTWPYLGGIQTALGISPTDAARIFMAGNKSFIFGWDRTRPDQVARSLEKLSFRLSFAENGVVAAPCDMIV